RAVVVVLWRVETRDVDTPDPYEPSEHFFAGAAALTLPLADEVDDLDDRLLAVAERENIDEVGEGIGVKGAGAAADDERMCIGALFREHRQAAEVEHVEDV